MDFLNNQKSMNDSWMFFIAERLSAGQTVRYLGFRGVSMRPMLRQGKDYVELSPLPEKLKKYDLPVYRRSDGQYVMHRIIGEKEGRYICLGDNTITLEYISPEQMIGMVSAFKRGEKRIEVCNRYYKLYCFIWVLVSPVRIFLFKGKNKLFRWIKRFIKDKK